MMKLSKQIAAEALEAYHTFWEANLSADMEAFSSYLVDDFSIIGTANGEVFFSREDAVAFYTATADQMKGKIQLRNRDVSVQGINISSVVVREQSDVYALIGTDWTFYGHARISCVIINTDKGWKAVHQHASLPDHRTEEGQQIAAEKIEKENLELKEAVQRRTIELQSKNRELEIEAAVERVRAQSMAMQQTNDIAKVNQEIFTQISKLNIDGFTGVAIYLVDDEEKVTVWDLSSPGSMGDVNSFVFKYDPAKAPTISEFIPIWKAGGQEYFVLDYPKEKLLIGIGELEPFYPGMAENFRSAINSGALEHQWNATAVITHGILSLDMIKPPTEEVKTITLKMAAAFNLAHQRFYDLQNAETQARESQVEAALEKVRSRSLAVHKSEEFKEVVKVVFEKLRDLGIDADAASINIIIPGSKDLDVYIGGRSENAADIRSFRLMYADDIISNDRVRGQESGVEFYAATYSKVDKDKFFEYQFEYSEMKNLPDDIRKRIFDSEHYTLSTAFNRHSLVVVNNFLGNLLSEYEISLLKRFAKVFEQAYVRFLDLQKAEAQAKEAQVEAALERVRSRTMGMQKSEELKDVIQIVYDQFVQLKIPLEHTGFVLDYKNRSDYYIWIADKLGTPSSVSIPWFDCIYYNRFNEAKKNSLDFFSANLTIEEKNTFYHDLFKHLPGFPEASKDFILQQPALTISTVLLDNVALYIENFSGIPYTDEENAILIRLAKVFEQTYTRFLDLQKAEAQTRAARIELAVERVRAKALAMHSSTQILDLVGTLKNEMLGLEIPGVVAATIYLQEADGDIRMWDLSSVIEMEEGFQVALDVKFNLEETDPGLYIRRVWNNQENYFIEKQEAADMVITIDWLRQYYPEQADEVQQFLDTLEWKYLLHPTIQLAHGKMSVDIWDTAPPAEMESILVKMGAAFDLAYKRFLDLQQSEKQIREGQIELALERVRAKTMAMQHSNELADTAAVLFQQIKDLGFQTWSCGFFTWQKDDMVEGWMGADSGGLLPPMYIPYNKEPTHYDLFKASLSGVTSHHKIWEGRPLEQHYTFLKTIPSVKDAINMLEASGLSMPGKQCYYAGFFEQGYLLLITKEPDDDLKELSRRFAKVFEQTYTRFLDLQKAEAQTREVQIELSLERIRAKVTAMKVSTDLLDIVVTMRTEFVALAHEAHYFWHMRWLPDIYEKAMTSGDGTRIGNVMTLPRHMHGDIPVLANWENSQEPTVVYAMEAEDAVDYVHKMITLGDFEQVDHNAPTLDDIRHIGGLTFIMARTTHGEIGYSLPGNIPHPPADGLATLVRFAAVFDLAYRRFEDLKSSEKQIREAQIELALERVRARTMAMQHSDELADASFVLDTQVRSLGIRTWGCAFNIYGEKESTEWFSSEGGMLPAYKTPREDVFLRFYEAGQSGEQLYIEEFIGESCKAHYEYLCTVPIMGDALRGMIAAGFIFPERQIDHATFFKYGYLLFITLEPVLEAHEVFIRFAKVFEQTYTRFLDLKKAEIQSKEVEIELALERVRAKTMSMQHSNELLDSATVLFNQVRSLGVPTWNCSFNIWSDDKKYAVAWNGTKDGFGRPFNTPSDKDVFFRFFEASKQEEEFYVEEMGGEALQLHYHFLETLPGVSETLAELRAAGIALPTFQVFHIAYFAQGYLMFITYEPVPEFWNVFKRFAKVFEQTYTRFLDLQKAEAQTLQAGQDLLEIKAARKKAEEALTELQATQKQLIQSEKMASLGELTAGIAHEIQNPLNFVNNFSEINRELINELVEEADKGNTEEVKLIAGDIRENSEKINHHGRRADGIVKGMLQHSRTSSGQKEPTDINAICDEYLRLSYHGLRAKDKSFNAKFETNFDPAAGKVPMIPQDIGRVIMNLLTNAFYAVNERVKTNGKAYSPTVCIGTKKLAGKIEITISDNGSGIPDEAIDKIFQPFFTTKPTGEGTGLGLSLSYDIIDAHDGSIDVKSTSAGTQFIIRLNTQEI